MARALTNKQMKDYEQLCLDRLHGRLLTPDGLRTICASLNYDPEAIGRHFLDLLPRICPQDKQAIDLTAEEAVELLVKEGTGEHTNGH